MASVRLLSKRRVRLVAHQAFSKGRTWNKFEGKEIVNNTNRIDGEEIGIEFLKEEVGEVSLRMRFATAILLSEINSCLRVRDNNETQSPNGP
jgi:hypothetical protein